MPVKGWPVWHFGQRVQVALWPDGGGRIGGVQVVGHPCEVAAHRPDGGCRIPFLERCDDLMMIILVFEPALGGSAAALEVTPDMPLPAAAADAPCRYVPRPTSRESRP